MRPKAVRSQAAEGRVPITLPAAEWASKLPRGWTCRDDRRAEALALGRQEGELGQWLRNDP